MNADFGGLGFRVWGLGFGVLGFPEIRGTLLGVPIIRTLIFWGLYCGPLILGKDLFLAYRDYVDHRCPTFFGDVPATRILDPKPTKGRTSRVRISCGLLSQKP